MNWVSALVLAGLITIGAGACSTRTGNPADRSSTDVTVSLEPANQRASVENLMDLFVPQTYAQSDTLLFALCLQSVQFYQESEESAVFGATWFTGNMHLVEESQGTEVGNVDELPVGEYNKVIIRLTDQCGLAVSITNSLGTFEMLEEGENGLGPLFLRIEDSFEISGESAKLFLVIEEYIAAAKTGGSVSEIYDLMSAANGEVIVQ